MSGTARDGLFARYAGLAAAVVGVGLGVAAWLPETAESRVAAVLGVGMVGATGALALVLKRRAVQKDLKAALKVVGVVFGVRAVSLLVTLLWVVSRGWGAVAFVAGYFGTYFALQWIEVSYVMAASQGAAGGDE